MKMEAQPVSIASGSGAHIRSRITVVCAECKRLKLKCDRRTPCSSCIKRDTVPRCLYSAAAAEKIDVQSLHNRVLTLESRIAQLASQTYASLSAPNNLHSRSFLNDRTIVATGSSGSSIIISLDDVAGIWLEALDISDIDDRVVLTPQPPSLPAGATSPHVFTDLDFNKFRIPGTFADPGGGLGVTSALVHILPQNLAVRDELLKQLETTLELHPFVNFPHFKGRVLDLYKYAAAAGGKHLGPAPINSISSGKTATARARSASTSMSATNTDDMDATRPSTSTGLPIPRPSLSFFSAAAVAFALSARILGNTPATGNGTAGTDPVSLGQGQDKSSVNIPAIPSQQCITSGLASNLNSMNLQGGLGIINKGALIVPSTPVFVSSGPTNSLSAGSPSNPTNNGTGVPPSTGSRPLSHTSPSQSPSATSSIPSSPAHPGQPLPLPSSLFTLSLHSLTMHELSAAYDLDYLVAMLLQVLFLLYDNGGLRNPSVPQILFPMVGKMVNVARLMGLWVDPGDVGSITPTLGGRYGLFESEMRRRIWWDIYFYDLFVSDAMGQPPLIQDDIATCNLPADVNEEQFSPSSTQLPPPVENAKSFSYFALKCRLAQLVKGMKKRSFRDPYRVSPTSPLDPNGDLSIDAAIAFESEVANWIAEIPPMFRLNMLEEDFNQLVQNANPILVAQQCEIMTITSRLVIKIFVPFLRRAKAGNGQSGPAGKAPHHAVHACVNAAHSIIHASKVAHALYKHSAYSIRSESLFYSFGRQIFDAAVISAHSVITSPQSLFAKVAMEDLKVALEIMRDSSTSMPETSPFRIGLEGAPGEALKIVEILQSKAEVARSGGGVPLLGVKRKHVEVEESLKPGFQMPYVGGGVFTSFNSSAISNPSGTVISHGLDIDAGRAKFERRENHVGRDRCKQAVHVTQGTRVRTNSSKSTDSTRGPVSEAMTQVKNRPKGASVHRSPMLQSNMPVPPPGNSVEASPFSPPPSAPAIPPQTIQHQGDFSHMVSPISYRSEDEHMMHYPNSQNSADYPSNPPPSAQGMYDYNATPGPSPSGSFYTPPTPAFNNQGSVYSQPTMPNHTQTHAGMPPPMLGLATRTQVDGNQSGAQTSTDPRFQHQQRPDQAEPMGTMQYDVGQVQNGWMDPGRYPAPETQSTWNPNYHYWKGGPP